MRVLTTSELCTLHLLALLADTHPADLLTARESQQLSERLVVVATHPAVHPDTQRLCVAWYTAMALRGRIGSLVCLCLRV